MEVPFTVSGHSKPMKIIRLNQNPKRPSLAQLVEGCRRKEEQAQEGLFRLLAPRVLTTCRRYETASMGPMDILQETFLVVFENIHKYDDQKGEIESWIKKIAVNTALKEMRRRKIEVVNLAEYREQVVEEPDQVEEISEERILTIIQGLPTGYRTVFNLYVFDGFSHKEIAELLGISPQTSKSQLSKARKMIRSRLPTIGSKCKPNA